MWRFGVIVVCWLGAMVAIAAQASGRIGQQTDSSASVRVAARTEDLIYTAAILPRTNRGDIGEQANEVMEALNAALVGAGSSLAKVVSTTVTITRAEDLPRLDEVFRARFGSSPPARTTLIGQLTRPGALVQIQAIAVPANRSRQAIAPAGWAPPSGTESHAMLAGDTLFLSGLVAREADTGRSVGGDAAAQVKAIMDNAGVILKAAGMTYDNIVSGRITVRDMAAFNAVNAVYREYWQKDRPSRATVQGDIPGGGDVSITFVAVSGGSREVVIQPRADGKPGVVGPNLSPAIKVGNRLFVSGNTGSTEANRGDVAKQVTEVLTKIGRTLTAAGFSPSDVVYSEVWLTDIGRIGELESAYAPVFRVTPPARLVIGIPALAGRNTLVEIAAVAVK